MSPRNLTKVSTLCPESAETVSPYSPCCFQMLHIAGSFITTDETVLAIYRLHLAEKNASCQALVQVLENSAPILF